MIFFDNYCVKPVVASGYSVVEKTHLLAAQKSMFV